MLSTIYAAVARRRRERFARRPERRQRLRRPVISVGNLAVGGRGKTPMVECLARLLLEMGERPAILSRGYGRRTRAEGVVVVRDPDGMRADLDRAGDEPLMLARRLPGVSVLVSSDRYLAGRLAEHHLGATIHILDDGFQHMQLDRDVDLVLARGEDLQPDARTLPSGRLREPPDTIIAADAILATDDSVPAMDWPAVFRVRRKVLPPRMGNVACEPAAAIACAGIAEPAQFFAALRASGWTIAREMPFRDHHRYSGRDLARIEAAARERGARMLVTTEKDYVRLLPFRPFPLPVAWVPLTMEPDPLPPFRDWLAAQVRAARDQVA